MSIMCACHYHGPACLAIVPGSALRGQGRTSRIAAARTAETREAVRIYNDLTDGTQVAGLFHSTC